jgi:hypothetical protein
LHRHGPAGEVHHPAVMHRMPSVKNRLFHERQPADFLSSLAGSRLIAGRSAVRVVADSAIACLVSDVPSVRRRVAFLQRGGGATPVNRYLCQAATCRP